jgi:hypothetical protein
VSRWQLGKNHFIPGFVTSRCRFVEQRRPVSALVAIRSPSATELPARPSGSQLRWGLLVGTLQRDVSP